MNKGEFVEALADRLDVSRAQADRALSAVLDIIAEQLGEGEKVAFTGFGSFEVSERDAPTGDVPQSGAPNEIAAWIVPKYTAGATLKAAVNKRLAGRDSSAGVRPRQERARAHCAGTLFICS